MCPPFSLPPTITKTSSHWNTPISGHYRWHLPVERTWVKSCYLTCYCRIQFVGYVLCSPFDLWRNGRWQRGTLLLMTHLKEMEMFRFDGVKKEINKRNSRADVSLVDRKNSKELFLAPPHYLSDLKQVSWAWAHWQHSLLRVNFHHTVPLPVYAFLSCGKWGTTEPGGRRTHRTAAV